MSNSIIVLVIDADVARSSGTSEHPVSSGSRNLLSNVMDHGHKVALCPMLLDEWKKHRSNFSIRWMSSMFAKKRILLIKPNANIRKFIETSIEDCRGKEIALKDVHLVDAALNVDKIIASNDETARGVFKDLLRENGEVKQVVWFNAVLDCDAIAGLLVSGAPIAPAYYIG